MEVIVHPHALKHLTEKEVLLAVSSVVRSVRVDRNDNPRWLSIGWLPDGREVELILVDIDSAWLVIHANTPVQKKFRREILKTERRLR